MYLTPTTSFVLQVRTCPEEHIFACPGEHILITWTIYHLSKTSWEKTNLFVQNFIEVYKFACPNFHRHLQALLSTDSFFVFDIKFWSQGRILSRKSQFVFLFIPFDLGVKPRPEGQTSSWRSTYQQRGRSCILGV